jgi:hypothetical protein
MDEAEALGFPFSNTTSPPRHRDEDVHFSSFGF